MPSQIYIPTTCVELTDCLCGTLPPEVDCGDGNLAAELTMQIIAYLNPPNANFLFPDHDGFRYVGLRTKIRIDEQPWPADQSVAWNTINWRDAHPGNMQDMIDSGCVEDTNDPYCTLAEMKTCFESQPENWKSATVNAYRDAIYWIQNGAAGVGPIIPEFGQWYRSATLQVSRAISSTISGDSPSAPRTCSFSGGFDGQAPNEFVFPSDYDSYCDFQRTIIGREFDIGAGVDPVFRVRVY